MDRLRAVGFEDIKVVSETKGLAAATHFTMREIVHIQAGQCGNQIGAKVRITILK